MILVDLFTFGGCFGEKEMYSREMIFIVLHLFGNTRNLNFKEGNYGIKHFFHYSVILFSSEKGRKAVTKQGKCGYQWSFL